MNDLNRRGFLARMAHVPFLAAWLKPKLEEKPKTCGQVFVGDEHIGDVTKWGISFPDDSVSIGEWITWIPISESLPPEGGQFLYSTDAPAVGFSYFLTGRYGMTWREWLERAHVTHWARMPNGVLPQNNYVLDNGECCGVRRDGLVLDGHHRIEAAKGMWASGLYYH